ncbi:MAG: hypothetical protein QM648_06245 [Solirubrobacterales bacterium]
MSAPELIEQILAPLADSLIEPGEKLLGAAAATQVKTFSGGTCALVVTDRRLIVQSMGRTWTAKGEPRSIAPRDVVSANVSGLADGWQTAAISVADDAGHTVKLRLADGSKLRFMLMAARGKMLGPLSGGAYQRAGAEALLRWLGGLDQVGQNAP